MTKREPAVALQRLRAKAEEERRRKEAEDAEEAAGIVRRLTMNDIQKWQECLIEFLIEKEDGIILQSYRNNDFDVADITTPKNAFLIIEECCLVA